MENKDVCLSDILHATYVETRGYKWDYFTVNNKGRKFFYYKDLNQQQLNDLVRDYYDSEYSNWEDIKSKNVTVAKRM